MQVDMSSMIQFLEYITFANKVMMVCQLYVSSSPNTTLIGIEYMIDSKTYEALPDREKPNWHYHKEEFSTDRANPKFPLLNEEQQKEWLTNYLSHTERSS